MKALLGSLILICLSLSVFAQEAEKPVVQNVIQTAYVDGIHNRQGIDLVKSGFHPGFEMLGKRNDMLTKFPIYSWIKSIEQAMQTHEVASDTMKVTAKYPIIDVSGDAAMAKVELYRNGKHLFTDYLLLYKFESGWQIVSKNYFRIPE